MVLTRKFFHFLLLLMPCLWISGLALQAQDEKYARHGWQLTDYRENGIYGAGVTKAYQELLRGKKSHPVIVAVIDNGVDTAHEDLAGHIWVNKKEIPGNGIDDDHNGYVDDVHGWNFLGGKDGRNITVESYESYREYYRLHSTYVTSADSANAGDAAMHYWMKVKRNFLKDSLREAHTVSMVSLVIPKMEMTDSILRTVLHKEAVYARDLEGLQTADSVTGAARRSGLQYFRKYGISSDMTLKEFIREAGKYLVGAKLELKSFSGDPNALRREIVRDNFNDIRDRNYGNNNVAAGMPSHGTHVSGIIAASRHNGKGIDGVADQVLILPIRAVPDGDERDKDVALAIRYAVDNGARIINMSFGKYFSPNKHWVDAAVRYAEDHDVLLVRNAGNEMEDIDSMPIYPNAVYENGGKAGAFLTIAANSGGPDSNVVARFSNYGQMEVDLFAPGVKVYSTVPGNQYEAYSGTSMASPVVAGVAALLLEYYPELSAGQLKSILMKSVMKLPGIRIRLRTTGNMVYFSSLSASGGIVNAYNALKLAATLKGERGKVLRMKGIHGNPE
jgi:subtilisin family serine protease